MKTPSLRERLLSKAVINWDTGCWEWTGAKTTSGYGRMSIERRDRATHRVAYELIEGPIPEGLFLDHLCRNRACCNPAHLEPVTPRENTLRSPIAVTAVNARLTHCKAGHPFSDENTSTTQGFRRCRTCDRERVARYAARHPDRVHSRRE